MTKSENSAPATSAGTQPAITISGEAAGLSAVRQPRDDAPHLAPVEPHHRQDRAELDHHGEGAAGVVEAQGALGQQQVRRRRHRQELGESLHHAEQRRGQQFHAAGASERRAAAALTFTAAAGAAAPAPPRLPRMMAMAAAMKTVE